MLPVLVIITLMALPLPETEPEAAWAETTPIRVVSATFFELNHWVRQNDTFDQIVYWRIDYDKASKQRVIVDLGFVMQRDAILTQVDGKWQCWVESRSLLVVADEAHFTVSPWDAEIALRDVVFWCW